MSQKTKLSYNDVCSFIETYGCKLLSDEYINMKQTITIKCSCEEVFCTTFNTFKFGNKRTCNKCSMKEVSLSKRLSYEDVRLYIESKGCHLVSDTYTSSQEKLSIRCKCGNIFETNFNKFKDRDRTRCLECVGITKWDFNLVKEFVEIKSESGCRLISDFYRNRRQKLRILCKCNNEFHTDFHCFLYGGKRHCNTCGDIIRAENIRNGIDYLRTYVSANSTSTLISDSYENYRSKLQFYCECGNKFTTCFLSFMNGKRKCDKCTPVSKMEYEAESFLSTLNVKFQQQFKFNDLLSPKGRKLKFDFAILSKEDESIVFLLELDGEQHFKPANLFGGEEKLNYYRTHDKLKNDYCTKNNIPLIRISYKDSHRIYDIISDVLLQYDYPVLVG